MLTKLKLGAFSPCSKIWGNGAYRDATKDEMYSCCNERCKYYNTICTSDNCDSLNEVCRKLCESVRYDPYEKHFDECMTELNCLKNDILDYDCLKSNKKKLIDCCVEKCGANCENHCNISYSINLERSKPDPIGSKLQWVIPAIVFILVLVAIIHTLQSGSVSE